MTKIRHAHEQDFDQIEDILNDVFGEDRFARPSYALRKGREAIADLSYVISEGERIYATIRFWPVTIEYNEGTRRDILLLGPLAVTLDQRNKGYGRLLMDHAIEQVRRTEYSHIILVGDEDYYSKSGFSNRVTQGLHWPKFDQYHRLLGLEVHESRGVTGGKIVIPQT